MIEFTAFTVVGENAINLHSDNGATCEDVRLCDVFDYIAEAGECLHIPAERKIIMPPVHERGEAFDWRFGKVHTYEEFMQNDDFVCWASEYANIAELEVSEPMANFQEAANDAYSAMLRDAF